MMDGELNRNAPIFQILFTKHFWKSEYFAFHLSIMHCFLLFSVCCFLFFVMKNKVCINKEFVVLLGKGEYFKRMAILLEGHLSNKR